MKTSILLQVEAVEYFQTYIDTLDEKLKLNIIENLDGLLLTKFNYLSNNGTIEGFAIHKNSVSKLPSIIYNRGGNTIQKRKKYPEHELIRNVAGYAKEGFFVISSSYSGGENSDGKDNFGGTDIDDVVKLYDVLDIFQIADKDRIGLLGVSRGGMMNYILLSKKISWIKTAVMIGAPSDLEIMAHERPEMLEHVFAPCFGGSTDEMKKRSGVYLINDYDINVPLYILHGQSDDKVGVVSAINMYQRCLEHNISARLGIYENGDHSLHSHGKIVQTQIKLRFQKYLK